MDKLKYKFDGFNFSSVKVYEVFSMLWFYFFVIFKVKYSFCSEVDVLSINSLFLLKVNVWNVSLINLLLVVRKCILKVLLEKKFVCFFIFI